MTNKGSGTGGTIALLKENRVVTDKNEICEMFNDYFINIANDLSEDSAVDSYGPLDTIFPSACAGIGLHLVFRS